MSGNWADGNDSLRYALGSALAGNFDISVTVKARVQLNDLVNFTGTLRITEDGGGGLNAVIPPHNHNYSNHHEATLTFVRRGVELTAGAKDILFTTLVTGNNPPDVHFVEVENLKLTPTALVNSANVGQFVQDWAEEGNPDPVPDDKLSRVHSWALGSSPDGDTPAVLELGSFLPADVADIPNGGENTFYYRARVQKDTDGTLAYIGGSWAKADGPTDTRTDVHPNREAPVCSSSQSPFIHLRRRN